MTTFVICIQKAIQILLKVDKSIDKVYRLEKLKLCTYLWPTIKTKKLFSDELKLCHISTYVLSKVD